MSNRYTKKTGRINKDYVEKGAGKTSREDVRKVLDRAEDIKNKFSEEGPLHRFIEDFKLLIDLVRDYWSGEYREIAWSSIAAITFALLYVLNPIDLIPDFIPLLGQLDDAAVVGVCLTLVEKDLHKYRDWKAEREGGRV